MNKSKTFNANTVLKINRILWIIIFIIGASWFALMEWKAESSSSMAWFLYTGLWSAFCGITYTIIVCIIDKKQS